MSNITLQNTQKNFNPILIHVIICDNLIPSPLGNINSLMTVLGPKLVGKFHSNSRKICRDFVHNVLFCWLHQCVCMSQLNFLSCGRRIPSIHSHLTALRFILILFFHLLLNFTSGLFYNTLCCKTCSCVFNYILRYIASEHVFVVDDLHILFSLYLRGCRIIQIK